MALKQRRWSGAALAPASFAKGYLCLLETWDANPAAAGKLKKERVREKESMDGKKCIDLRVEGSAGAGEAWCLSNAKSGCCGAGKGKGCD